MYKKMIFMNVLGGIAWVLLGMALYPSQLSHQSLNLPLAAILLYAMIVAVPFKTAYVFYVKNQKLPNSAAQVLNYALIIFFVFSYVSILATEKNVGAEPYDLPLLISLFLVVIPAILNIQFLKRLTND
jgi:hypothetical protein